ncbi:hypothetical protein B0H10DRAFT_2186886 [Mycena sp. CBHHK59/15]|nr:hypothetical protein B0H10DRAFT_2186886 [Mycena sp. CBHHK59/15]
MAQPPLQQLAQHVQATATTFQLAATSLTALAAAPLPVGGAPQWAIDMENRLSHQQQWDSHILKISLHNMKIAEIEQAEWNVARFLNSIRSKDVDPLTPLPTLFARLPVPAIPALPVPGAAVNLPPPFAPPPIVVPAAHALFPADMAALRGLTSLNLNALLVAYGCPGQNLPVNQKRAVFARHIGVAL